MPRRSLSPTEASVVLSLEEEGREEVTLDEIQHRAGVSRGFARKLAHGLRAKGWLQRVGRGRYLLNPSDQGPDPIVDTDPFRFGSRLVRPYYFGFATAAELHRLLPQLGRTYYVVTPRRGVAEWGGVARFRRVTVRPQRFFGLQTVVRRGEKLSVSDPERTVVDCLDRPELCGGLAGVVQILDSASERVDWWRLERYVRRFGSRSLARRLGFLVAARTDRLRPPSGWLDRLRPRAREPFTPLGAPSEFGRRGARDPRWHVIRNVPDRQLLAEVDVR
ncbi:MAG TPA: type IV toxin-antitoxin system AbiEi family antitoxin [Thermoplasmata archaeon]|nr:type IV toxin-antitoxin system AbiEi family antitoxin [Thermoplasmata archaeon]